jgi:hypothetical protein
MSDIDQSKWMATSLQLVKSWTKLVEVVKGRISAGGAQKSHEPCSNAYLMPAFVVYHFVTREVIGPCVGPTLAQWGHVIQGVSNSGRGVDFV